MIAPDKIKMGMRGGSRASRPRRVWSFEMNAFVLSVFALFGDILDAALAQPALGFFLSFLVFEIALATLAALIRAGRNNQL